MAITLGERIKDILKAVIESPRLMTPSGSIANIGTHFHDNICRFSDPQYRSGEGLPSGAIFVFHQKGEEYYGVVEAPEDVGNDPDWFATQNRLPLKYYGKQPPTGANLKAVHLDVIKCGYGGCGGSAAIAQRAFLDLIIYSLDRYAPADENEEKDKERALSSLREIQVFYVGIDSEINGLEDYYSRFGVVTEGLNRSLMIKPHGHCVTINSIVEIEGGVGRVVLSPEPDGYRPTNRQLQEVLSPANFPPDLSIVALDTIYDDSLLREGHNLFSHPDFIRAGAFTEPAIKKNADFIKNSIVPACHIIAVDDSEIKELTGKELWGGIGSLGLIKRGDLTLYVTRGDQGIIATDFSYCYEIKPTYSEQNFTLARGGLHHAGVGDAAKGVCFMSHFIGLPLNFAQELVHLFAQYRMIFDDAHDYARNIRDEIGERKRTLTIEKFIVDPAIEIPEWRSLAYTDFVT